MGMVQKDPIALAYVVVAVAQEGNGDCALYNISFHDRACHMECENKDRKGVKTVSPRRRKVTSIYEIW